MFKFGDLITDRHNYKDAVSNVYMFIQNIYVDPTQCIVYDLLGNNLVFKQVFSLVPREDFIGRNILELNAEYIYNERVQNKFVNFVNKQQRIAKQKFVFLRDIVNQGVTLRVHDRLYRPTSVHLDFVNTVYWQDMIVFTGWSQVGSKDYIHLSTLLPNCRYLQKLMEID